MTLLPISERAIAPPLPNRLAQGTGFAQPFEMLQACHERVQRMLALLARLMLHLANQGCDAQARQAAVDVMRYFDIAAPLHHQDEELHVFPVLIAGADQPLRNLALRLQHDHGIMAADWDVARQVLQGVVDGEVPTAGQAQSVQNFAARYADHLQAEDQLAYPAAQLVLSPSALQTMQVDMMQRRGLDAVEKRNLLSNT